MIRKQLLIFVVLITGVAIGFFVGPAGKTRPDAPEASANPRGHAAIQDQGESSSLAALRRRIAELEAELARARAATNVQVAAQPRPPEGPGGFRARLEEIRKSDPARYVQMTNNFAQWTRRRRERQRETMDFLSSVDVSQMGKQAQKTHSRLMALNERRAELEERLRDESLTDEERHKLFGEMREMHHELRDLNQQERANLLGEMTKSLGFQGDEAMEITETIQSVVQSTDGGFGHQGPPPPPPGGNGGPAR